MQIHNDFKNSINFRDLKGLKTNDGKTVKEGLFYRGAGLNFMDEDEFETFKNLNVKCIVDLRSIDEIKKYPDPYIDKAKVVQFDGVIKNGSENIDWSPAGMKKIGGEAFEQIDKINDHYRRIAFDNPIVKLMVKEIENDNLPMYIHCAVGKDRTGVAVIILLLILDVKEEEIKKDYLLSNDYRKEILQDSLNQHKEQIDDNPELGILLQLQDGVLEKTYEIVINSIKEKYGSIDEYLFNEYDLDDKKLKELRNRYTE